MSALILISGKMASGKTTFAEALASRLGAQCASFGQVVRTEAARRGLPLDRESLQHLGQHLVENNCEWLCQKALNAASYKSDTTSIIEGLRHLQVYQTLKGLTSPGKCGVILLSISKDLQGQRISERDNLAAADALRATAHATELEVDSLIRGVAGLILDAGENLEANLATAQDWVLSL